MQRPVGIALLLLSLGAAEASAASFTFNDFSDVSTLTLNGNAARVGTVLRVTSAGFNQTGTAFITNPITLNSAYSFSTFFSFQITGSGGSSDGDGAGADGITFIVQTNNNTAGGFGGGIGYSGIPNSVAIEYDTWNNGSNFGDADGNHVGVDLAGNIASVLAVPVATRLNNGNVWYSWIDYNGATDQLEVRLSTTSARPAAALLSYNVDLSLQLSSTSAFVGFGSGTGAAFGNHDILTWQFRDEFAPIDADVAPSAVPEPATATLVGLGCVGLIAIRRRRS